MRGCARSQIGLIEILQMRGYIDLSSDTLQNWSKARVIAKDISDFKNELS